jgi:hypothetical protein
MSAIIREGSIRELIENECTERDQLHADKAELLAELKRLHAYATEHCAHKSGLLNASAIIAKHEAKP